jgi:hypothetical protein
MGPRCLSGLVAVVLIFSACGGSSGGGTQGGGSVRRTTAGGVCRGDSGKRVQLSKGLIVPNRGAAGVFLGMRRRDVIACLGHPLQVSNYGVMTYGNRAIFDVYFDHQSSPHDANARVVLLNLAGPGFCLRGGICAEQVHGLEAIRRLYPSVCASKTGDGEPVDVLPGRFNGHTTRTTIFKDTSAFRQVEISYARDSTAGACHAA